MDSCCLWPAHSLGGLVLPGPSVGMERLASSSPALWDMETSISGGRLRQVLHCKRLWLTKAIREEMGTRVVLTVHPWGRCLPRQIWERERKAWKVRLNSRH